MPAAKRAAKKPPAKRQGSIIGAGEPREDELDDEVQLLDPGDTVEVSISTYYKQGGHEAWFKVGTVVHVRPGEDPEEAFARGNAVTLGGLAEAIESYINIES